MTHMTLKDKRTFKKNRTVFGNTINSGNGTNPAGLENGHGYLILATSKSYALLSKEHFDLLNILPLRDFQASITTRNVCNNLTNT